MTTMRFLGAAFAAILLLSTSALAAPPEGKGKSQGATGGGNAGGAKGKADTGKGPDAEHGGGHGAAKKATGGGSEARGSARKEHGADHAHGSGKDDDVHVHLRFDDDQTRIIRDWFDDDDHLRGLPPGLAKRERLPPGLEKQLVRNGRLPPGLEKKLQPLPDDLAYRLPRLPDGYRRWIVGDDLIVLDERTSAIIDVIHGVARIGNTF